MAACDRSSRCWSSSSCKSFAVTLTMTAKCTRPLRSTSAGVLNKIWKVAGFQSSSALTFPNLKKSPRQGDVSLSSKIESKKAFSYRLSQVILFDLFAHCCKSFTSPPEKRTCASFAYHAKRSLAEGFRPCSASPRSGSSNSTINVSLEASIAATRASYVTRGRAAFTSRAASGRCMPSVHERHASRQSRHGPTMKLPARSYCSMSAHSSPPRNSSRFLRLACRCSTQSPSGAAATPFIALMLMLTPSYRLSSSASRAFSWAFSACRSCAGAVPMV
mmetsp:Transcript_29200/g.61776  ORF Transcript_29200/g.61776 Transcript_29200/m.61776 type:complete len:275 (+) Transcript_29200:40-864(+)